MPSKARFRHAWRGRAEAADCVDSRLSLFTPPVENWQVLFAQFKSESVTGSFTLRLLSVAYQFML
jgi:hypothetical protein